MELERGWPNIFEAGEVDALATQFEDVLGSSVDEWMSEDDAGTLREYADNLQSCARRLEVDVEQIVEQLDGRAEWLEEASREEDEERIRREYERDDDRFDEDARYETYADRSERWQDESRTISEIDSMFETLR